MDLVPPFRSSAGAPLPDRSHPSLLADTSQLGDAPWRSLARPDCGALRCCRTNVASLRVWWSVRKAGHGGEGMRLPALHSGGQVPALESDPYLSPLLASGWVAHS